MTVSERYETGRAASCYQSVPPRRRIRPADRRVAQLPGVIRAVAATGGAPHSANATHARGRLPGRQNGGVLPARPRDQLDGASEDRLASIAPREASCEPVANGDRATRATRSHTINDFNKAVLETNAYGQNSCQKMAQS